MGIGTDRFWSKVDVRGHDECWVWRAARDPAGYGRVGLGQRVLLAHRAAYLIANGNLPAGKCVCHRCDNPSCVNPAHLFLGTYAENNADMRAKNRAAPLPRPDNRGERHGLARLTEAVVLAIRASNNTQRAIAAEYGVSRWTVRSIRSGQRWGHV